MMGQVMASPSSPRDPARIAAITVSYGSADALSTLFDSLPDASAETVLVVVADNKADDPDNVAELTTARGARYLPMTDNLGYGGAVNAAVADLAPTVEWLLVVNPDVVMAAGSIDALVKTGEEDPTIGSVGPATLTSDGEIYPSARAVPSLRTGVGHALFANLWLDNPWTRAYRDDTTASAVRRDAGWLSGSCLLIRRSAFEQLGGFDDGYFMYFEDVDLGYRLGTHGYRNVYEPAAVVAHSGAHSTTSESSRMISAHHDSARRFLTRKYAGPLLWPVRVTLTVGLQVRSALVRRRANRQ
jgi:N-acetylglucosaminyl-diphospho-decaprenol L-rhamnosyltransferase